MKEYLDLVQNVLDNGEERPDRTGVGVISLFGTQTRYDLRKGFPLVTTKKVTFSNIVYELLWFLSGSTYLRDLKAKSLWEPWAFKDGTIGPGYGHQWRSWGYKVEGYCTDQDCCGDPEVYTESIDQIREVINSIQKDPYSRRHIVSAWKVDQLAEMALPPCHLLFQFYVSTSGELDLHLFQRSGDIAVGIPYNIASYALLLTMVAQECNLIPRYFLHSITDNHIYKPHIEGLKLQLAREPRPLPYLFINKKKDFWKLIEDQDISDFKLEGYNPHPFIKYEVAV